MHVDRVGVILEWDGGPDTTFWSGDGSPLYKYTSSLASPIFKQ